MTAAEAVQSDILPLAEVLDLTAARPLVAALLARRGHAVELDASEVRRLGGVCLQVLLSAIDTWAKDGATLSIRNPSAAFVEGLERLGVHRAN